MSLNIDKVCSQHDVVFFLQMHSFQRCQCLRICLFEHHAMADNCNQDLSILQPFSMVCRYRLGPIVLQVFWFARPNWRLKVKFIETTLVRAFFSLPADFFLRQFFITNWLQQVKKFVVFLLTSHVVNRFRRMSVGIRIMLGLVTELAQVLTVLPSLFWMVLRYFQLTQHWS